MAFPVYARTTSSVKRKSSWTRWLEAFSECKPTTAIISRTTSRVPVSLVPHGTTSSPSTVSLGQGVAKVHVFSDSVLRVGRGTMADASIKWDRQFDIFREEKFLTQKFPHPWGPGTTGSSALRNPHLKSPCVGEERRAGLGQALPIGSPIVGSRDEPYRAILRSTLLHPAVSYVSNATSPPCPTLTSL